MQNSILERMTHNRASFCIYNAFMQDFGGFGGNFLVEMDFRSVCVFSEKIYN